MPFDGVEFLRRSLPQRSPSSIKTTDIWQRHWHRPFETKRAEPAESAPDRKALATLRLLGEARHRIEARQRWTRGVYETAGGKYCAVGALRAAGWRLQDAAAQKLAHALLLRVARGRGFRSVQRMNDRSTHEQVLLAFDEAIATAQSRVAAHPH
jgi:hypothetical protein